MNKYLYWLEEFTHHFVLKRKAMDNNSEMVAWIKKSDCNKEHLIDMVEFLNKDK